MLLPAILGPVINKTSPSSDRHQHIVGHKRTVRHCASSTGCRPEIIFSRGSRPIVGRQYPRMTGQLGQRRQAIDLGQPSPSARKRRASAAVASRSSRNSSYSSCLALSSAVSTFSSYSFNWGVTYRSAFFTVCRRMILGRHFVAMRIRDFQVVTKDVVEADL